MPLTSKGLSRDIQGKGLIGPEGNMHLGPSGGGGGGGGKGGHRGKWVPEARD